MNDNIHWINGFEEYFTYIQHPQLVNISIIF